jgi:hypothetical protein
MERIYVKPVALSRLRGLVESGIFAVPQLQREFVWNATKACQLLDSIYRNYPIGTLLVWKTSHRNEGQLRKSLHILPPYNSANKDVFFLVDGQQRLSVLWHLMGGGEAKVRNADRAEVDFSHIHFDPSASVGDALFVYRKRLPGDLGRRLVPVVDMLSPGWRRRLGPHKARALARIENCRSRVLSYKALIVFCETGELAEVRETFVRINSLGMKIGAADRAFARASKFDLRGHVRDCQTRLKHGFDRVSEQTVLQTTALALGRKDLGERAIDAMVTSLESSAAERARFDKVWRVLRESFAVATDYLVYELNVPNFGFLPSEPMVTILALFFLHNRNKRPSRAAKERLRQWFWATAVGARYTGRGYRPNILADAAFVERLANNRGPNAVFRVRVPRHVLRATEYGRPGPLSNAFFCLLRLKRPRYLEDGTEIPPGEISSRSNRSDKHHIFPRALLNHFGIASEKFNSILNICFLVARENQSIGQKAPKRYLSEVPRSGHALNGALRSHLIPSVGETGVWDRSTKRGFRVFLEQRAEVLVRAFEDQANMRLFEPK